MILWCLLLCWGTPNSGVEPHIMPDNYCLLTIPDTVFAHQRLALSPYLLDNSKVSIHLDDTTIDCPTGTKLSQQKLLMGYVEIPYPGIEFTEAVLQISSPGFNCTYPLCIYSERWMDIYLDEDLQFTILWEGARPLTYSLISSGRGKSPTECAHSKVYGKQVSAEFYDGGEMKWWMAIQRAYDVTVITDSGEEKYFEYLENGTHAPLRGTYHQVGSPASHGCVRNPLAKIFWDHLQVNDRVELHYRNSGSSYSFDQINPAWRYIQWDPILEVDSSLIQYMQGAWERIQIEFNL